MKKEFAKVLEISGCTYVLLPKKFVTKNGLEKDSFLQRVVSDDTISFRVIQ